MAFTGQAAEAKEPKPANTVLAFDHINASASPPKDGTVADVPKITPTMLKL